MGIVAWAVFPRCFSKARSAHHGRGNDKVIVINFGRIEDFDLLSVFEAFLDEEPADERISAAAGTQYGRAPRQVRDVV